jgi:hypothetical protein
MSISTKAFPTLGGWHPSYKELFLEFTGIDGKKYRTGLRPKEYPFYAGVPIINGTPDFSQAVFLVDKNGNVKMKNAYIEGTIIAGFGSEIDWSYVKNVLVQTAQIADLAVTNAKIANIDAGKITTGYLSADRIAARSITADKLNVSQLSAISANLGTITAGNIYGVYIEGTTIQGSYIRTAPPGQKRIEIVPSSDPNDPNEIIFYKAPNAIAGAIWLDVVDTTLAFLYLYGLNGIRLKPSGVDVLEAKSNGVFIRYGCYPWYSATYNLGSYDYKWANLYLSGNAYVDGTVNTTYLAASYLSQSLNANGYSISNLNSLYCSYLYASYLGQSLNANVKDITNLRYLYFNSSYGRIYWGSDLLLDIYPADTFYGKHFKPISTAAQLNIGDPYRYFNEVYAYTFRYKVPPSSFQHYDDIQLLKNIKETEIEDSRTKKRIKVWELKDLPEEVKTKEGFIDQAKLQGFIIGVLKALVEKIENLETKINELEKGLV